MKKWIVLLALLLIFTGCDENTVEVPVETEPIEVAEVEVIPEPEPEPEVVEPVEVIPVRDPSYVQAPLSGLWVPEELTIKRPVAVMIDNHYKARPQSGLSEAEIVYEILAEGRITRYMAVFQVNEPEKLGPVRSARSYYIDKALEYDPLYVHVGGSPQAFDDVVRLQMADMDGLASGAFWRTKHKKMPHNAYTNIENLRAEADRRGYKTLVNIDTWQFNEEDQELVGTPGPHLKFVYKAPSGSDSTGYYSEFKYDEDAKVYYRYVNSTPHKDETSDIHLSAKNIFVQVAPHRIIDNEGRRDIDVVGSGRGYYLTNGNYIPVTWSKEGRRGLTRLYDVEGNEVIFNPGVTWVQVVSSDMNIGIE